MAMRKRAVICSTSGMLGRCCRYATPYFAPNLAWLTTAGFIVSMVGNERLALLLIPAGLAGLAVVLYGAGRVVNG